MFVLLSQRKLSTDAVISLHLLTVCGPASLGGMRYLVETKRRVKTKIVIIQNSYINGSGRVRLPPEEWLEEKKN